MDEEDENNLEESLTEQQKSDFKEAFMVFDRDKDGKINMIELQTLMKALGQSISQEELDEIFNTSDPEATGTIEERKFLRIMANKIQLLDESELIVEAFKVFDPTNRGVISVEDFRRIMRNLGNRLTEDEVKLIVKDSDPDPKGFIRYDMFVDKMAPKK